jgi:hypothetical protein
MLCSDVDVDRLILLNKQRAVYELLEKYPRITFCEISFELQKESGAKLNESVEQFKCRDGRYIVDGKIVSREYVAKELSQIYSKLLMTAWIKESEDTE